MFTCTRQHIGQRGLAGLGLDGVLPFLVSTRVVRHCESDLLCQIRHRIAKARAGVLSHESNRVARSAAAEAVVELLARADRKTRRLFAMKRAKAHQIGAALFQLHMAAHHIGDVDARKQFGNKARWNHRASLAKESAHAVFHDRGEAYTPLPLKAMPTLPAGSCTPPQAVCRRCTRCPSTTRRQDCHAHLQCATSARHSPPADQSTATGDLGTWPCDCLPGST